MKTKVVSLLLMSTIIASPAFADSNTDMEQRILELEAKLEKFEGVLENVDSYINAEVDKRLQARTVKANQDVVAKSDIQKTVEKEVEAQVAQKIAVLEPAAGDSNDNEVEVSLTPAPSFKTKDGSTTFALDGRIMVDAGFADEDGANLQDNAADIRYAWLGAKGTFADDWAYRFLVGFENDETNINDAFIAYNGFDDIELKVGNFKEFQGIEAMSSNLHNTLQERSSATTTFRPIRSLGLASTFYGEQWSLQAGVFGDDPGSTTAEDEANSVTGRFVYAPILDKETDQLLHLGASTSYRMPDESADSVRFRARGESNVIDARLVDTGVIADVDDYITYGAEARYTYGPFSLMGEYNFVDVSRENGSDDVSFDGGYLTASYFLTGEQRGYKVKDGTYGRVKPNNPFSLSNGGAGAWEIAARYSTLDLNDGPITGGELDAYTFGVNWYPTDNTKFMLNYIINNTDDNAITPNDDPNYITLRAQVDF